MENRQEKQTPLTLQTSLRYLKGVGPERCKTLARLGLYTLEDLFYFFPRRYEDRRPIRRIGELTLSGKECAQGKLVSRGVLRLKGGRSLFKAVIQDGRDILWAVFFNQPYLNDVFKPNVHVVVYGQAEKSGKFLQMVHPEYEIFADGAVPELVHTGRIVPIYSLTEDLSQKGIRQLLFQAITRLSSHLKDPLHGSLKKKLRLAEAPQAFRQIHFPQDMGLREHAYRRLVFDEFFLMQLWLQRKKAQFQKENKNLAHAAGQERVDALVASLGFEWTTGQKSALNDILNDMKKGRPMHRLLQGDVGSGKTAVAAAALVFSAANGFQGALMAPTEVLAQQHFYHLSRLLEPLGISCGYLAQESLPHVKQETLRRLAAGEIQVVAGTHALIQPEVKFKKLGLAIVDEQHKFGVFQRAALMEKGPGRCHFLLMTATPIPRTLAWTLYGDLDVSAIQELPQGRKPIKTFWVGENKREAIYKFLDEKIEKGGQAYVICPAVETSRSFSAKSVFAAHHELETIFKHRKVAFLHGRMKSAEKRKVMEDFKARRCDVLVSTVVIEVGIDVPNANIMIIENADRFGLAQLHQLRGRVGRGSEEALCILFSDTAGPESRERLEAFQKMQSGFDISEKDLVLRGSGDLIGARQHGLPELRIGDLIKDAALLLTAKEEAVRLIEKDPTLDRWEHRPLAEAVSKRFQASRQEISE